MKERSKSLQDAKVTPTNMQSTSIRWNHATVALSLLTLLLFISTSFRSSQTSNPESSLQYERKEAPLDERPTVFGVFTDRSMYSLARAMVLVLSARKANNTMHFVVFMALDNPNIGHLYLNDCEKLALEELNMSIRYMKMPWAPHWMKPVIPK